MIWTNLGISFFFFFIFAFGFGLGCLFLFLWNRLRASEEDKVWLAGWRFRLHAAERQQERLKEVIKQKDREIEGLKSRGKPKG